MVLSSPGLSKQACSGYQSNDGCYGTFFPVCGYKVRWSSAYLIAMVCVKIFLHWGLLPTFSPYCCLLRKIPIPSSPFSLLPLSPPPPFPSSPCPLLPLFPPPPVPSSPFSLLPLSPPHPFPSSTCPLLTLFHPPPVPFSPFSLLLSPPHPFPSLIVSTIKTLNYT